jgi:hypothetical protein
MAPPAEGMGVMFFGCPLGQPGELNAITTIAED